MRELRGQSVAATAERHHVVVLLQHHVLLVVEVQQTDGLQPVRNTAGSGHLVGGELERVHDGAHGGVVGGPQVATQGERAGASAVVGVVAAGRDDPAGPADLVKVDEERHPLAGLGFGVSGKPLGGTAPPAGRIVKLRRSRRRLGLTC